MQKNRILLLDDEEAILFAFKDALSYENYFVDTALSLDEVEQLLLGKKYNGAVLDLRLGGTDEYQGFSAIELIKKYNPHCKIIIVTAYGNKEFKTKAFKMGADVFREKPVSPNDVIALFQSFGLSYKE